MNNVWIELAFVEGQDGRVIIENYRLKEGGLLIYHRLFLYRIYGFYPWEDENNCPGNCIESIERTQVWTRTMI